MDGELGVVSPQLQIPTVASIVDFQTLNIANDESHLGMCIALGTQIQCPDPQST
jgi:hypothetical protein